jgi:hypothetical protein
LQSEKVTAGWSISFFEIIGSYFFRTIIVMR